jgi:hypothetical protein
MTLGVFEWLSAGGDLATMALVFMLWKLDKRVSHLEWWRGIMVEREAKNGG